MKSWKTLILTIVAIVEAIAIAAMLVHPARIEVRVNTQAVMIKNPFYWAFFYEAPDSKFEQLVKQYPNWVSYREPATGWSALSECAALKRTNVARILIAHGASVEQTIKQEGEVRIPTSVNFLRSIQEQMRHSQVIESNSASQK